jgi:hypothetical protein
LLPSFTHIWNTFGFPSLTSDVGMYLGRSYTIKIVTNIGSNLRDVNNFL